MKRIHLIISGRVQGVGFRYFCSVQAAQLGLSGYARNREDGAVEIGVQGDDEAVNDFLARVHRGPRAANVTQVVVESSSVARGEKSFVIG